LVNETFPKPTQFKTNSVQMRLCSFIGPKQVSARRGKDKGTPEGDAMGMLRTGLILAVGFVLLPSPPPDQSGTAATSGPSAFAYMAAAAETMADMRGFCQRNPNACVTGAAIADTVEGKVRYSLKLAYEWANDGDAKDAKPGVAEFRGTLTDEDLEPAWRKPKPLKKKS
jgi:hypothetical protein